MYELTLIKPCVEERYLAQLTELVNQGWTIAGTGVTQPNGNFAHLYSATLQRAVQAKAAA
jgi:hypothetical protein